MTSIRFAVLFMLSGCISIMAIPFPPKVRQGGRAVSVAVDPTNANNLLVASETGGLFRSSDGGVHFQHVAGLASFNVVDVRWAATGSVAIASTAAGFHKATGPIWRTSDGGVTWAQPVTARPPAGPRCGGDPSGWAVSFEPGGSNAYAGTDCGLAVSNDLGATWSYVIIDPTQRVSGDKTQDRVLAVLAQGGGRVNLTANSGIWYRTSSTDSWHRSSGGNVGGDGRIHVHALAASPFNPAHLALADSQLYFSSDGGASFTVDTTITMHSNREPFVRITSTGSNVDLYVGDGTSFYHNSYRETPGGLTPNGAWTRVAVDHADPADVAFSASGVPVLLASDGGVHLTSDGGATWKLTGAGPGGYDALQMTEVTGQAVSGTLPHQDLYFGTQDNDLYASSDGGSTWPNSLDAEGFYIRTDATSVDHTGSKVTSTRCGGCWNSVTDPHFVNPVDWTNPNSSAGVLAGGNPFLLGDGQYIQLSAAGTPPIYVVQHRSASGSWTDAYNLPFQTQGPPLIAGGASAPTIYHVVRRPGKTPSGLDHYGLVKVTGLNTPAGAVVSDADNGLGTIGLFFTAWVAYPVIGLQNDAPNHLIAADLETGVMNETFDGGATWSANPSLTTALAADGSWNFNLGIQALAHAVGFDPSFPCQILVGSAQGIFRTGDGGSTWALVDQSPLIGNLSSLYFPPSGDIFVSSYGSGLWKVSAPRSSAVFCGAARAVAHAAAAPSLGTLHDAASGARSAFRGFADCANCRYLVVKNGAITQVDLDNGRVVRVLQSGGLLHLLDSAGKELPFDLANSYGPGTRGGSAVLDAIRRDKLPIRGLILDGNQLKGVITSAGELPFTAPRVPYLHVFAGQAMTTAPDGGKVTIYGQGFAPGVVRVLLDGKSLVENLPVDARGNFRTEVEVRGAPGRHELAAEQREQSRLTVENAPLWIAAGDARK